MRNGFLFAAMKGCRMCRGLLLSFVVPLFFVVACAPGAVSEFSLSKAPSFEERANEFANSIRACLSLGPPPTLCSSPLIRAYFDFVLRAAEKGIGTCRDARLLGTKRKAVLKALVAFVLELMELRYVTEATFAEREEILRKIRMLESPCERPPLETLEALPRDFALVNVTRTELGVVAENRTFSVALRTLREATKPYVDVARSVVPKPAHTKRKNKVLRTPCMPYQQSYDLKEKDYAKQIIEEVLDDIEIMMEEREIAPTIVSCRYDPEGSYVGLLRLARRRYLEDLSSPTSCGEIPTAGVEMESLLVQKVDVNADAGISIRSEKRNKTIDFRIDGTIRVPRIEKREGFRRDCFAVGHQAPGGRSGTKAVFAGRQDMGERFQGVMKQLVAWYGGDVCSPL